MRRTGLVVLIVLLALAGGAAADSGIVAEWHFDEGSGSVLHDSSVNGNDGVIHGATWVDGKVGGALRFDGNDDYVEVPRNLTMGDTNSHDGTVELWLKSDVDLTETSPHYYFITTKESGGFILNWQGVADSTSRIRWNFFTGTHHALCSDGFTLYSGLWYFVAATWGSDGMHLYIYKDGTVLQYKSNADTVYPSYDVNCNTYIGATNEDGYCSFNGIIDEVRIYNRALTSDEIKSHYELASTTSRTPAAATSTPSVRILDSPSTIHGGEDVEMTVVWENVPPNWKLVVSLEKSETDKDRLADDVERTISGTGEALFKLNAYQIDETYDRALVWASLRDESGNWKGIYTNAGTTVLPAETRASRISATSEPSPVEHIATPTPTRKSDGGTTEMLKLAGGTIIALLAIALLAGKLRGKRQDATFEPPTTRETKTTPLPAPTVVADPVPQSPSDEPSPQQAPPEPAQAPKPEPAPQPASQPVPEPMPARESVAIEVRRGYEVLQNNDIRFGIRVINPTPYLIADVETILDYAKTLFSLKDDRVQTLANIHPNGERTAKYVLTPRGCVHNEKIDATIIYRDHTGNRHTVQMRPKEVHCVCPFLKENPMREGEFAELATKSKYIEEGLSFGGISPSEIAAFIKESCTHRLHIVGEHEIDSTIVLDLAGESIGEKAYYLLTAVIQPYKEKDVTQIALRAYSDKPYGLRGFLNEIAGSVRHLMGSVQSAKEIGIIEENQVINIIDSVVQRTRFGGAGQGANTEVNIKGGVVHRSDR